MKKKTVKNSTMLNLKSVLMIVACGIWINLLMEIKEDFGSPKDIIIAYGGNTLFVIISTYIVFIIIGLFIEVEAAD